MQCPQCGMDGLSPGQTCPVCTGEDGQRCVVCHYRYQPGARFCGGCGRPVGIAAGMDESALAFLQSHVPAQMLARIRRSANSMLGERKHVTVLFADLRGSTSMVEGMDAEHALEIIGPAVGLMMDAVHQNDGLVNQTRGDGIMALFGAPLSHEDHAVRACFAALAIRDGIRTMAQRVAHELVVRIGLNSGQVVIHSIGSDLAMHFEAAGLTTHLAARMEQLAAPGTVLLTAATLELAKGFIEVNPKGHQSLRGVSAPVNTFELTGVPARTRWQVRSARGLSVMVGREAELDVLNEARVRAEAGNGQTVIVGGPPGFGNSRCNRRDTTRYLAVTFSGTTMGSVSTSSSIGHVLLYAI